MKWFSLIGRTSVDEVCSISIKVRVSRAVLPRVKSRNSVFLCEDKANQATEQLFVTKRVQWRHASGT
jgi:hypothetical protein